MSSRPLLAFLPHPEEGAEVSADHVALGIHVPVTPRPPPPPRHSGASPGGRRIPSRSDYELVFRHILENAASGGPLAGSTFWTWGGYGRATNPAEPTWRRGDEFTGDPPQEPQGRNSVFATDRSTLAVVKRYAARMNPLR